jgi:FAD/FMN-containing dehydrogenase
MRAPGRGPSIGPKLISRTTHHVAELRAAMTGLVVAPGEAGWDEARRAWNLAVDQRPALVAIPESIGDVQAAVRHAAAHGLSVVAQGTGHQASAIRSLEDALLIKTLRLRGVKIDAAERRAYVRAGDLWQDVTGPASELGLAPLAGSSPDVGVVGYSLGGGVSWLGRKHGLAANGVTAIAVVLGDGRLVRADADHHADLFWALRGGGGGLGVVVGMEMELHPVASLVAGALMFPWERTAEVAHAWRDWVDHVPDEVTSILHLLQLPPDPALPEFLRGRKLVSIEAAILGTIEEADRLLAPLRALGAEIDTVAPAAPVALAMLHMDPPHPVPGMGDHVLLAELPHAAVDAFIAAVGPGSGSQLLTAELRHLGGALRVAPEGHGALATLDGAFMAFGAGAPVDEDAAAAVAASLGAMYDALCPWEAERVYTNFVEHPTPLSASFDDETYERLRAVKAERDPDDLFRTARAIV